MADAVLVGKLPRRAPLAPSAGVDNAVSGIDTRPIWKKDKPLPARDTHPILVHHTIACWDAVCRIEADSLIGTFKTHSAVCNGAVLRGTPHSVVEDDVPVALDAPPPVTASARRADGREAVSARLTLSIR